MILQHMRPPTWEKINYGDFFLALNNEQKHQTLVKLPESHSFPLDHIRPPEEQSQSSSQHNDEKNQKQTGRILRRLHPEINRGIQLRSKTKNIFNAHLSLKIEYAVTFPPTFIPSVIVYMTFGGFGAACAENKPFGFSTNSRFRSFPGGAPTWNS